jgi:hypothetical protein
MKKARGDNEIEAALERLDRLIDDEVRATVAQTLQAVNKAERELLPSVIIDDQGPESIAGDNVQRNVKEWLSPPDPWENHNVVHDTRHDGTGTWLIQGDTCTKWKSSGRSSLLWINGKRQYFVLLCLIWN